MFDFVIPAANLWFSAIALGLLILLIALRPALQVMRELIPGPLRTGWGMMLGLIVLFILGYMGVLAMSLSPGDEPNPVVAVIFLLGAWFVLLVCQLGLKTLREVARHGVLDQEHLTDALMGLETRSIIERRLHEETTRARRYRLPFCVVRVDVDRIDEIRTAHGDEGVNRTLRAVGRTLRGEIRFPDTVARFGPEMVVVLLPHTPLEGAKLVAERLRQAIGETTIPTSDTADANDGMRVTATIGVAMLGEDMESHHDLTARAELALREAKKQGGNRVVVAPVGARANPAGPRSDGTALGRRPEVPG